MINLTETPATVAIQGLESSYHARAAREYFGATTRLACLGSFREVFAAVVSGAVDAGLVATENSIAGGIRAVYDLLRDTPAVTVTGEIYLVIEHSLGALTDIPFSQVQQIVSHPAAFDQCSDFISSNMPDASLVNASDTAAACKLVKDRADDRAVALAGSEAIHEFGLKIIASQVANEPFNSTRFLALSRLVPRSSDLGRRAAANKTSLYFERLTSAIDDLAPGTLHQLLGCFARANIGLTMIESRPLAGKLWRYGFYLDCSAGLADHRMQEALADARRIGAVWRNLGTYAAAALPQMTGV